MVIARAARLRPTDFRRAPRRCDSIRVVAPRTDNGAAFARTPAPLPAAIRTPRCTRKVCSIRQLVKSDSPVLGPGLEPGHRGRYEIRSPARLPFRHPSQVPTDTAGENDAGPARPALRVGSEATFCDARTCHRFIARRIGTTTASRRGCPPELGQPLTGNAASSRPDNAPRGATRYSRSAKATSSPPG